MRRSCRRFAAREHRCALPMGNSCDDFGGRPAAIAVLLRSPPTSGSSRSCAAAASRPSRRSTTATTAASSASAATCSARPTRPRTRCSTRSWPPTATSWRGEAEIQLRPWLYTIARNRCLLDAARPPRAARWTSADDARHRAPVERSPAPPGRPRAARRRRRAARGPAGGARARRARRCSHDEIATVLEVPREKVKALVFQARTSLIASRTARDTPCEEIREQLANLPRRRAAAHDAAPPPARVPGLPGVPARPCSG